MEHTSSVADVLNMADRKCSGRQACEIEIPNPDFNKMNPCDNQLVKYLEVSYTCLKGIPIS